MKVKQLLTHEDLRIRQFAKKYQQNFPDLEIDLHINEYTEKRPWQNAISILHPSGMVCYNLERQQPVALQSRNSFFMTNWRGKIFWENEISLENLFPLLDKKGEEWASSERVIFTKRNQTFEELLVDIDTSQKYFPVHLPTSIALESLGQGEGAGVFFSQRMILYPIDDITWNTAEENGRLLAALLEENRATWEGLTEFPNKNYNYATAIKPNYPNKSRYKSV